MKRLVPLAVAAALLFGIVSGQPAHAAPATPAKITSVSSTPGPLAGQLTISWKSAGTATTHFRIETGLHSFTLGSTPRGYHKFYAPRRARTLTLEADDLALAGAPLGSASHLYFRVVAVNHTTAGWKSRAYPYLQKQEVQPVAPSANGSAIRVASFNVRSVKASTSSRSWVKRAPYVAKTIISRMPGVIALQEDSPGPYNLKSGSMRQTEHLLKTVKAQGGTSYAMVRTTPYAKSGTKMGSQGARIMYDAKRYTLLSTCPEMTGKYHYNASCTIRMPLPSGSSESKRRLAPYAQFKDRATGQRFWFVSVHLDNRDGKTPSPEFWETARGNQITAVTATMDRLNTGNDPVIIAGDLNTWQNTRLSYAPHTNLLTAGYYDTAAALTRINLHYSTMNHFLTKAKFYGEGFGSRLDVIAVKGAAGASRFENVMKTTDSFRASDHNMIVSDFTI